MFTFNWAGCWWDWCRMSPGSGPSGKFMPFFSFYFLAPFPTIFIYCSVTNSLKFILVFVCLSENYSWSNFVKNWNWLKKEYCNIITVRFIQTCLLMDMASKPLRIPYFLFKKFYLYKKNYLFMWLHQVLVVACRISSCRLWTLSCNKWDLVPRPGIKPGPPALGELSQPLDR